MHSHSSTYSSLSSESSISFGLEDSLHHPQDYTAKMLHMSEDIPNDTCITLRIDTVTDVCADHLSQDERQMSSPTILQTSITTDQMGPQRFSDDVGNDPEMENETVSTAESWAVVEPSLLSPSYSSPRSGCSTEVRRGLGINMAGLTSAKSTDALWAERFGSGEFGCPKVAASRASSTPAAARSTRSTTLDIPGLTRSKASPDGRIAQTDIGSKLIIIMVGLPARGKSYITKKLARYLNWLQHDTRIFNVGERRRLAAVNLGAHFEVNIPGYDAVSFASKHESFDGRFNSSSVATDKSNLGQTTYTDTDTDTDNDDIDDKDNASLVEQSADFFNPSNRKAAMIRESAAMETLDELFNYILVENGSIAIFDATNSTLERRKTVMSRIRERCGSAINVLFVESVCQNESVLEANMRLKLSGPDYKDKDPLVALDDFRRRVIIYEQNYIPLGQYEEEHNLPYVKIVDVGRKVISHQVKGFLSTQAVYYLLNFNLAPRTIWMTRHGESIDNIKGKIGGDSSLSEAGRKYARALFNFMEEQRWVWEFKQRAKAANTHFPPHPGDHTPPNPYFCSDHVSDHCSGVGDDLESEVSVGTFKNFSVWTSMLKRTIETATYFEEDDRWDVKQFRMLNDLNVGLMDGMTYSTVLNKYSDEVNQMRRDKMAYRYPGPGGEGYLDVINRLRPIIVELERMEEHCLLITHGSVARVLLAYFLGLNRDAVAEVDCPLGFVYCLEPKPYGVEFRAFRYNELLDEFEALPEYELRKVENADFLH